MEKMEIISINRGGNKGTVKRPIKEGILRKNWGLVGDAHVGPSNRQVSLLGIENIEKFTTRLAGPGRSKSVNLRVGPGDFAENITTKGVNLNRLQIGARLRLGKRALIEITQRGKECHTECEIKKLVGNCIMPKEGLFGKVIYGGKIRVGDSIEIEERKSI